MILLQLFAIAAICGYGARVGWQMHDSLVFVAEQLWLWIRAKLESRK